MTLSRARARVPYVFQLSSDPGRLAPDCNSSVPKACRPVRVAHSKVASERCDVGLTIALRRPICHALDRLLEAALRAGKPGAPRRQGASVLEGAGSATNARRKRQRQL